MEFAVQIYLFFVSGSLLLLFAFNRITSPQMRWIFPILLCSLLILLIFIPLTGKLDQFGSTAEKLLLLLAIPASYLYILNQFRIQLNDERNQPFSFPALTRQFTRVKSMLGAKNTSPPKHKQEHKPSATQFMSKERAGEIEMKIREHFLENKPYLQHGYSLRMLSNETHIPLHHLSAFINKYHKMNFNDFINEYRILFCIDKFFKKEWKFKKLEAIAEEAGFNNRNTFTTAFKKATGLNPSEFLKYVKLGKFQKKQDADSNGNGIEPTKVNILLNKLNG